MWLHYAVFTITAITYSCIFITTMDKDEFFGINIPFKFLFCRHVSTKISELSDKGRNVKVLNYFWLVPFEFWFSSKIISSPNDRPFSFRTFHLVQVQRQKQDLKSLLKKEMSIALSRGVHIQNNSYFAKILLLAWRNHFCKSSCLELKAKFAENCL